MKHHKRAQGFTLIELLVFCAIFSVAIVGFITVFIAVTRVQTREQSSSEVNEQSQFLIQQIQYYVSGARLVDMTQDAATGTLQVREAAASLDPTIINASSGTVYITQGVGGTLQALTSNKVSVTNLSFTRHFNLNSSSSPYGTDSVSYSFTMTAGASNTTKFYSQSFQSAAAVFAPVGKIGLIQKSIAATSGTGLTTITSTYPTNNETSSLLIAVVSNTGTSAATVSLGNTAGDTWTQIANPKYAAFNQEVAIFAAVNAKNSSNTVTITFGTGVTNPSLFLYEYRGAATASSFDASSTLLQANTGAPTSGSASPASGSELLMGVLYSNPSIEIPNAGGGFTIETTSSVSATYVEDQDIFVTGAVAGTWQYPTQTPSSSATIVTFK